MPDIIPRPPKLSLLEIDTHKDWLGYLIKNIGDAVDPDDAVKRAQLVLSLLSIDMHKDWGGYRIENLGAPTAVGHALRRGDDSIINHNALLNFLAVKHLTIPTTINAYIEVPTTTNKPVHYLFLPANKTLKLWRVNECLHTTTDSDKMHAIIYNYTDATALDDRTPAVGSYGFDIIGAPLASWSYAANKVIMFRFNNASTLYANFVGGTWVVTIED